MEWQGAIDSVKLKCTNTPSKGKAMSSTKYALNRAGRKIKLTGNLYGTSQNP